MTARGPFHPFNGHAERRGFILDPFASLFRRPVNLRRGGTIGDRNVAVRRHHDANETSQKSAAGLAFDPGSQSAVLCHRLKPRSDAAGSIAA